MGEVKFSMFLESFFLYQFSTDFAQKFDFSKEIDHSKIMNYLQKIIPIKGNLYLDKLEIKLQRKFKITNQDAKSIIQNLNDKEILIKDSENNISINILANTNRKLIYNQIKENPGMFIFQLQKITNIGTFQILYHMGVLLQFNLIQQITINKIKIFGISEEKRENILIGFYLMKKINRDIITHLYSQPTGATLPECQLELNHIPKSTINYTLQKLVHINLVSIILKEDKKGYIINEVNKKFLHTHIKSPISV